MRRLVPAIMAITAVAAGGWAVQATRGAVSAGRVSAGAVRAAGSWGRAVGVPGLAALNKGGNAEVDSVSCASAGNCAAIGYYTDRHHHHQGFVADERNGRWTKAIGVPGLAALNAGGNAEVDSVSCASAGNCAAIGGYADRHHHHQGFVADERNGTWRTAIPVPGLAALNNGGDAEANSVSCASPGNCVAGGDYADRRDDEQEFVADERNGRWSKAIGVPGLAALNNGDAEADSVSCPSPGNCAAIGIYGDRHDHEQGFVADERNGTWRTAIPVPGLAALNKGDAEVFSVSCASAGNCAAGGYYTYGQYYEQGFVTVERNGAWGTAIPVPGLAALNKGGGAEAHSMSCASPGNCAAVGSYSDRHDDRGFVAVERNGRWTKATEAPGPGTLNKGELVELLEVSCASPGNCGAGGFYTDRRDKQQGFVVVERNGRWAKAIAVPGLGALNNGGDASVLSVSCPSPGNCTAGGSYRDRSRHYQGFVSVGLGSKAQRGVSAP